MARWFGTARARATLAATAVVAIVLIVSGFVAVDLQRGALVKAIDAGLVARVDDLSALIGGGAVPSTLAVQDDDQALIQIIDSSGTVIASSTNIAGEVPIASDRPAPDTQLLTTRSLPVGEGDFRLLVRSVQVADQLYTIFAAAGQESVSEAVASLGAILLVGIPVLIGIVGFTVWVIVGRTLDPVEGIRAQVASIGDRELNRRVPVPGADDEIGRLAVTMNEMLARLERAANNQQRFVADASHELRSPLAAIRSQLEVNEAHPDLADWSGVNADLLDETLRMQRLVDDLLLLARSDGGIRSTRLQQVDLDDVVFGVVGRLAPTTPVTLETSRVSGAQIVGDPEALTRLVRNLLENATRYARSHVDISLSEAHGVATLAVQDDGPGVAVEDRLRVFERFTRVDEARSRDDGGSGLGLAICKEIAEHHGGSIQFVDSSDGARIETHLPLERVDEMEIRAPRTR